MTLTSTPSSAMANYYAVFASGLQSCDLRWVELAMGGKVIHAPLYISFYSYYPYKTNLGSMAMTLPPVATVGGVHRHRHGHRAPRGLPPDLRDHVIGHHLRRRWQWTFKSFWHCHPVYFIRDSPYKLYRVTSE